MSNSVGFVQDALRNHVAPPSAGVNVSDRIRFAARRLGWSYTRTKDAWYADPRISIKADEVREIEEATGIRYGREELQSVESLIANADAVLGDPSKNIPSAYVVAFRTFIRALAGPRT